MRYLHFLTLLLTFTYLILLEQKSRSDGKGCRLPEWNLRNDGKPLAGLIKGKDGNRDKEWLLYPEKETWSSKYQAPSIVHQSPTSEYQTYPESDGNDQKKNARLHRHFSQLLDFCCFIWSEEGVDCYRGQMSKRETRKRINDKIRKVNFLSLRSSSKISLNELSHNHEDPFPSVFG